MRQPKPFFRKSKGAWYLQIGKRQISLGRDKKAAWQRYHEIMADEQPFKESTVTVAALFERYLGWVQKNRKPSTYDKVRHLLSRFAKFCGKKKKAMSLRGAELSDWTESETKWNSTTRSDGIKAVSRCFNWAVGKDLLQTNPVAHVPEKPKRKRREVVFSVEDWQSLRILVKDDAFGDLLDFMWETGCRPMEARTMQAKHVDVAAGLVIFPPSEAKGQQHERVIFLTTTALEICRRRMDQFPEEELMRNTKGRAWTKDSINCRFQRLQKKLGRPACAYAIRHSFATEGLIRGMDSLTLSQLMGHADVSMLAKYYAHLSKNPEYLRQQANRLRR